MIQCPFYVSMMMLRILIRALVVGECTLQLYKTLCFFLLFLEVLLRPGWWNLLASLDFLPLPFQFLNKLLLRLFQNSSWSNSCWIISRCSSFQILSSFSCSCCSICYSRSNHVSTYAAPFWTPDFPKVIVWDDKTSPALAIDRSGNQRYHFLKTNISMPCDDF